MSKDKRNEERTVLTPKFRVAFPHLFQPAPPMKGNTGPAKYQLVMLFPEDSDLGDLKRAAGVAVETKWNGNVPSNFNNPFRNGTEYNEERVREGKPRLDGYDGHIFVSANSIDKPGLVDQNLKDIISKEEFYAGCYARAQVFAHPYDTAGNRGVTFFLNNVQKMADGEAFSGKSNPKDIFSAIGSGNSRVAASKSSGGIFG